MYFLTNTCPLIYYLPIGVVLTMSGTKNVTCSFHLVYFSVRSFVEPTRTPLRAKLQRMRHCTHSVTAPHTHMLCVCVCVCVGPQRKDTYQMKHTYIAILHHAYQRHEWLSAVSLHS